MAASFVTTTSPDLLVVLAATLTRIDGLPAHRSNLTLRVCAPSTEDVRVVRDNTATPPADGAALGALNYARVPAGFVDYFPLGGGALYVAGSVGGGTATLSLVPSDAS